MIRWIGHYNYWAQGNNRGDKERALVPICSPLFISDFMKGFLSTVSIRPEHILSHSISSLDIFIVSYY